MTVALGSFGGETFDPIKAGGSDATNYLPPMFDFLLRADGANILPGVADKWELASDGLSWTFYIHKGIKFSNGEDLTADDVVFTIQRYASPDAIYADTRDVVKTVEKVDDYTIRVNTNGIKPFYPQTIAPMTRGHGLIMPKDYFGKVGVDYYTRNPIGSGSFVRTKYVPGDTIEYQAVDNHWRQTAAFKNVTIIKVPEESTRVAMMKVKQVDAIETSADSATELETAGNRVAATIAEQTLIVLPGTYQPEGKSFPTSDIRVRQALSLAINRNEIINVIFHGKAFPSGPLGVFPMSLDVDLPYWMDYAAKTYRYDPAAATQLLKDAGYPNGINIKLWAINRSGAPYVPNLVQVIQGYWDKIGVKAEIVPAESAVFTSNRNTLKVPTWLGAAYTFNCSTGPIVAERLNNNFRSTGNLVPVGTTRPDIDALIDAGNAERDPAKRKEIYAQLIKETTDTYTMLMIALVPSLVAIGPKVNFALPTPTADCYLCYYLDTATHRQP
jgi:peptide/nickel transport system substrate-binding protein